MGRAIKSILVYVVIPWLLSWALLIYSCSARAEKPAVSPLVIWSHISDPSDQSRRDLTSDFLGAGIAVEWKTVEAEGAVGRRAIQCALRNGCPSTLGGFLSLKWKPRKR